MSYIIRTFIPGILTLFFLTIPASAQDTYVYDNAGRLKSVTYGTGGPVAAYKYDDANNRTEEKVTGIALNIATNYSAGTPLNMNTLATSLGYGNDEAITFEVTVTADITGSGSSGAGDPAIETGTWPGQYDVTLKLIINSGIDISGGGGKGGTGGDFYSAYGSDGFAGGHAINMEEDLEIVNNGIIKGGGGGGGGGAADNECCGDDGYQVSRGGGGGGGGWPNGAGGIAGNDTGVPGTNGSGGTTSGGGNGGSVAGAKGGNAASNGSNSGGIGGDGGTKGWGIKKNGNVLILTGSGTNSGTGT